jgi:flavin reductase (DIM6/NTAB) family NADH-FMN oxidoreductase RutF
VTTAPMIEQFPVNLECKVMHILDLGSHELVVGRIEETYISEEYLTGGRPDVNKIKPIVYAGQRYMGLGEVVGSAFTVKEMSGKRHTS